MKMNFEELNGLLNIFNLSLVIDHDRAIFTDINSGNILEAHKDYNNRSNRVVNLFDGTGFYVEGETPYCKKEYFIVIKAKANGFYVKSIREEEANTCVIDKSKSIVERNILCFDRLDSEDGIFKYTEEEMELRDRYRLLSHDKVTYEVSEPYKYDGYITVNRGKTHCSMYFHKDKPGGEKEPIYGTFAGLFQDDALELIENSKHFKELLGYLSPDLAECYSEKNVYEFLRRTRKIQ